MVSILNLRSCLIYSATLLFITIAVCFSLLRAALPHAHGYVSELEATLTQQVGLQVEIGAIDAEMSWFTPRLILLAPRIRNEDNSADLLAFERIELTLSYIDSLRFMSLRVAEINLVLTELLIERLQGERWRVQGLELQSGDDGLPDDLRSVLENTDFMVTGRQVTLVDRMGVYRDAMLQEVDISVSHFLGEHTLTANVQLPEEYGEYLTTSVRYSGAIESVAEADSEIYIAVKDADAGSWLERLKLDIPYSVSGVHDIELWFSMSDEQLSNIVARLDSEDLVITHAGKVSWSVDQFETGLQWRRADTGWSLDIRGLSYRNGNYQWRKPTDLSVRSHSDSLLLNANYLHFRDIDVLMKLVGASVDAPAIKQLANIDSQSELFDVHAAINIDDIAASTLRFKAKDLGVRQGERSISGLDLLVEYSAHQGEVVLVTDDALFSDTVMFREPVAIDHLAGVFRLDHMDEQWIVSSDLVSMENVDISTRSRVLLNWQEASGLFMDIQTRYSGLPGQAASAYYPVSELEPQLIDWLDTAVNDGRVSEGYFMLHGHAADFPFDSNGKMIARFEVENMNLVFNSEWPALGQLHADVIFEDKSLVILGKRAGQYGARLESLTATIDDLYESVLKIEGVVDTPVADIQRYIWNSPLDETLGGAMNQLETSGAASLGLKLDIPLDDIDRMTLLGSVDFANSMVAYPALEYRLQSVQGKLWFDEESMWSETMSARFGGQQLNIDIETDKDDKGRFSSIHMRGAIPVDTLLTRFDWIPERWFSGRSPWDIRLTIPHYQSQYDVLVDAGSTLEGVRVDVSDHINKTSETAYPLHLAVNIDDDRVMLEAELPEKQTIRGIRAADGVWSTDISTAPLAGKVNFDESMSVDSTIELELDKLDLTSLVARKDGDGGHRSIPPASIPSIKLVARNVGWQRWKFDRVSLDTNHHPHGMLLSKIEAGTGDLDISGQGTWLSSWNHPHETSLTLSVGSTNLGNALVSQGFDRVLDNGSQNTQLTLNWPAEPYSFSWSLVNGSADVELKDGVVRDLDAGAGGRVLGLLNVFHLPRRLILDFSDLNEDGFVFDSITSRFDFVDGIASTSQTEILASIADMRVTGDVDMQNEAYDLVVRVKPNQSAATFTGGAIAGGAVVGASLVLLQKLLNLDKAAQDRYAITGSWDEPVVTQIEKAEATAAAEETDDLDTDQ